MPDSSSTLSDNSFICERWNNFLDYVRHSCSSIEFANWLEPIAPLSYSDQEIVLRVPNAFVETYLLKRHLSALVRFFPSESDTPAIRCKIEDYVVEASNPSTPTATPVGLNPLYQFDNFIAGATNSLAYKAALGVVAEPGVFNPLFIHGSLGSGKTHLLHSIGHQTHRERALRICCTTTENFVNEVVSNLRKKNMEEMKRYYRSLDCFLIDDIQFLQKRSAFIDEITHTFDTLMQRQKQIVITANTPLSALHLSRELIAKMGKGVIAEIEPPDIATRRATLERKAAEHAFPIDVEVIDWLANSTCHWYALEGAFNHLRAYCRMMRKVPTRAVAEQALAALLQQRVLPLSVNDIIRSVADFYQVEEKLIRGKGRRKGITQARHIAMYLARELLDKSLIELAADFGNKRHSTLLHAWKKLHNALQLNSALRSELAELRSRLCPAQK